MYISVKLSLCLLLCDHHHHPSAEVICFYLINEGLLIYPLAIVFFFFSLSSLHLSLPPSVSFFSFFMIFADFLTWLILFSFSSFLKRCVFGLAQSPSGVWLFSTPWTVATRLLCPWYFQGTNTGVGCHFLLQGIFWSGNKTWVSCIGRQILYYRATRETLKRDEIYYITSIIYF